MQAVIAIAVVLVVVLAAALAFVLSRRGTGHNRGFLGVMGRVSDFRYRLALALSIARLNLRACMASAFGNWQRLPIGGPNMAAPCRPTSGCSILLNILIGADQRAPPAMRSRTIVQMRQLLF